MDIRYGAVKHDGATMTAGSENWSSTRTGPGWYRISFNPQFEQTPVVVAAGNSGGAAGVHADDNVVCVRNASTAQVEISTMDVASRGQVDEGTYDNASFSFIAIG